MKDHNPTPRISELLYTPKRRSNKPSKDELKRMVESLKVTNMYDGDDAS